MKIQIIPVLMLFVLGLSAFGCNRPLGNTPIETSDQNNTQIPNEVVIPNRDVVESFIKKSPTYQYDGIDGTIKLVNVTADAADKSWEYTVEYQTRHAGHGDRTGQILAQVITIHTAIILMTDGEITSAYCDDSWDMLNQNNSLQELTNHEKLWKEQGVKDYDFTLQRQAFAPEDWRGPVNIQVRDGVAVSVSYVSDGTSVTGGKFDNADTIDKLFMILKDAYAGQGDFEQKADTINVTYHNQMGYPADFFIDVSQMIADEEQGYTVTNLIAR